MPPSTLLFIMAAGFAVFWLFGTDRAGKLRLGCAAVIGLALAVVFLLAAGKLHSDPRPFVQNPGLHPLFPHGPAAGRSPAERPGRACGARCQGLAPPVS